MGAKGSATNAFQVNSGKGAAAHTFDAIVVGSGISGGWAAKELCEKGLKTLVLERGRDVQHIKDYPTATTSPWDFTHRKRLTLQQQQQNPIASRCYAFDETSAHFFVKDEEHPYVQTKPFDWIRGYQVGGKSLIWGRWTQRWSDLDFEANLKDGIGTDWPIRYNDIAPWYSYAEKFAGISGNRDGLAHLPDGEFLPPMQMNAIEKHFKKELESSFPGRNLIISRTANLSQPLNGRGPCQYRNLCYRGCPFGGYFSSNSSTIPAAHATGNLTLRPFSVVHSVIYGEKNQRASGVRVIDTNTKETTEYFAKLIFLNAGTLNTTLILLNSGGLGDESGALGHYLMDHNYRGRVSGQYDGLQDVYYYGRRPSGVYLPRFRNLNGEKETNFIRGYAFAGFGSRTNGNGTDTIGAELKDSLCEPGVWQMGMVGMGEHLPYYENKVSLSAEKKDAWGMPLLEIDCEYRQNELDMLNDILHSGAEMLEKAGFKAVSTTNTGQAPGLGIHEMGTARMGRSPKTSVLNGNNQLWGAKNVFVTDGACMASSACQNPSLTYMALTARAADYAVNEVKMES